MDATTDAVFLATLYMMTKHVVADYFLQNGYMVCNKGCYGHPGGLIHAAAHAVFTLPVFFILPPGSVAAGVAVVAAEYVVHYHVDWAKDQITKRAGWQPTQRAYWIAFGVDQYLHILTCLAIVWYLAFRAV